MFFESKTIEFCFFYGGLEFVQLIAETGLQCLRGEKIWTVKNFDSKVCCVVNLLESRNKKRVRQVTMVQLLDSTSEGKKEKVQNMATMDIIHQG